jgi:DNA-binding CsgD family transcriptional regulator
VTSTEFAHEGLVGREPEIQRIEALLAAARTGRSGVLGLRGEPGIGKTALLREARARGGDDFLVLSATGAEGESDIPYAALYTLLTPVFELIDTLPELQRAALGGALALGPPSGGDQLTIGTAVLGLFDAAAEERPLLVMVDDAQWLDSASAAALLFAARRLGAERIALMLGIRDREGLPLDTTGITEVTLAGLGPDAAQELLTRGADGRVPSETVVDGLLAATAGNPLALLELPASLSRDQLAGAEPLGDPLAIGARLRSAFLQRVQALSDQARGALLLAAASSSERIEPVAGASAALDTSVAALDEAERGGLIELYDDTLRFHHPLVRAAVYHGAEAAERRRAHRALAEVETSPSRRAWHLADAAVGPDEEAAAALEAAAAEALSRGGQGAAAAALERAAYLTPAGAQRAARLVNASGQRLVAGSAERAVKLAEEALEMDPPQATRAQAQHVLSRLEALRGSLDAAHARGVQAAELIEQSDPDSAVDMYLEAGLPGFMSGRIEMAVDTCKRAYELARDRDAAVRMRATVLYGAALTIAGRFEEGRPLLERWLETHQPERMLTSPPELIGSTQSIVWIEEYDACLAACDQVIELARSLGASGPLQLALGQRAEVNYRLGHWTQSRADASESIRLAEATGQAAQGSYPLVVLSRLEAAIGLTDEAERHTSELVQVAAASGMGSMAAYIAAVQCLDRLGGGHVSQAADRGREVREITEGFGMLDPSVIQWRADFIEALVKSSREDEARAELKVFAEQAARTGRPWPNAAVARCRGLLADDGEIDAAFEEALAWHARGADPFERARTELSYGERLRRVPRPGHARPHLRAALTGFERLGAEPWARRARGELRASGGATPPVQQAVSRDLTAQELEVAALVARGSTNREAAAALFLSPKTVESHLSRIYRKLGVRSRTELASVMASGDAAA